MKKMLFLVIAVMMFAATAFAAGTTSATVAVTASVISICGSPVNGAMTLAIDPSAAGAQNFTVTAPATVKCTNNRTVAISAASQNSGNSSGTGTLVGSLSDGTNTIPYAFTFSPNITGTGFGAGGNVSMSIGGSVASSDAATAVYGNGYQDQVTLTIAY